ncbi:MAG: cell division protein FtsQ/DivIB [Deltaproteobacteria bacterium]
MKTNRRRPDRALQAARTKAAARAAGMGLLQIAAVLAIVAGLWFGGRAGMRWLFTSPAFAVAEIEVTGNHRLDSALVRQLSGLSLGDNVFHVDLAGARQALLGNPWVRAARLSRELPRRVRIDVEERRAVAQVELGELYLADDEGQIFKRALPEDGADLPVVSGIGRQCFIERRSDALTLLSQALSLLPLVEHHHLPRVSELHVDELLGLTVYLEAEGGPVEAPLAVKLGWDDLGHKLDLLGRARAELARRGLAATTIDLSNEKQPGRADIALAGPVD